MIDPNKERAEVLRQIDENTAEQRRLAGLVERYNADRNTTDPTLFSAAENLRIAQCDEIRLHSELERVDRLIDWRDSVKNADSTIKAATKQIAAATKAAGALDAEHAKLSTKLERLRAEIAEHLGAAERDAEQAATEYVAAAAQSDERAEALAQSKLDKANEAAEAAQRKAARQSALVAAMESELAAIDGRREVERQRLNEANSQRLEAHTLKVQAEWDAAAESLVKLGAKLVALESAKGSGRTMRNLCLPLTNKLGAGSINENTLRTAAEGVDLSALIGN